MIDIVDKKTRSRMMAGIGGKDTRPETLIRKALFRQGFRYRLHDRNLPGKPDLVLPKYRAVVFINGCFWHGHDCHLFKWPKTRANFWKQKIEGNVSRDQRNLVKNKSLGWRVAIVWECAIKGKTRRPLEEIVYDLASWLDGNEREIVIAGEPDRMPAGCETHR